MSTICFFVEVLLNMKNNTCENPSINKNEGKYKYLSLARLYKGEIICKNGNSERKNGTNKIKK